MYFSTQIKSAHGRYCLFCFFSVSLRRGTSSVSSGSRSVSLTVGGKTTHPSLGGFRIRSLALWERALYAEEVRMIYLAGTKALTTESYLPTSLSLLTYVMRPQVKGDFRVH